MRSVHRRARARAQCVRARMCAVCACAPVRARSVQECGRVVVQCVRTQVSAHSVCCERTPARGVQERVRTRSVCVCARARRLRERACACAHAVRRRWRACAHAPSQCVRAYVCERGCGKAWRARAQCMQSRVRDRAGVCSWGGGGGHAGARIWEHVCGSHASHVTLSGPSLYVDSMSIHISMQISVHVPAPILHTCVHTFLHTCPCTPETVGLGLAC